MADVNAVFISIDVYTAALDKLMGKLDKTTSKMIAASNKFDKSAGNILQAGKAADKAASKMKSFGEAASKTVGKMQKTSRSLDDTAKNMKKTGDAAVKATGKMQKTGKSLDDATKNMKKTGDAAEKATGKMLKTGKTLNDVAKNMKKTSDAADRAAGRMKRGGDTLKGVTTSLKTTGKDIGTATKDLLEAGKNIGNVNKALDTTKDSSSKAGDKLKGFIDKFKGLKNVTKAFDLADSLSISNSKLDRVNDGKQSDKALHSKVAAAAGSSRSTYKDMAGYVSKLSASGGTFKDNDQAIAFAELMQKAVVAGGADDRGAAMNQIIDSVSKGSLGSDDLKSASGASPIIMKSLQSYTGKSEADLYKMADAGKITANDIKNAMFSMSEGINNQFGSTKMTFGETWDKLKEGAEQAASGVLEKINEIISNPLIQQFIDNLIAAMNMLGAAASGVCDFIVANWNIIGPILGFIGGVALVSIITSLWSMIPVLWSMLPPIVAQAAAWMAANWPILLLVGILTTVITILLQMGVSFEQVCTAIGGFIGLLTANVYNAFITMWNGAAAFINSFGNAFHNVITNIKILFLDLALNALGNIADIANGFSTFIMKLTGKKLNIAAGITGIKDTLKAEKSKAESDFGDKVYVKDKNYMDPDKAKLTGEKNGGKFAKFVDNIVGSIGSTLNKNKTKDPTSNMGYQPFHESKGLPGNPSEPLKVEGTGAGGSVNVDMPDEDKEYLKNIAERDYIANVSTNSLAPNIAVQFGDVHETADANKVAGRIKKILREQIAMASEGVY